MTTFSAAPAPPLSGLHVLMVEDDAEVREATIELLEEEGARVTACDAAEPALDALAAAAPGFDLVFSDVVLGGPFSGFDIAVAALTRHPGLPVVLTTGYAGAVLAALPPWVPVLLKPFRRHDLLAAIATARRAATAHRRAAA